MTLNELKMSVLALGFEDRMEDEGTFRRSAERALTQLFSDLPVECMGEIDVCMPRITSSERLIRHAGSASDATERQIKGVGYSFVSSGNGSYTVTDKNGTRTYGIPGGRCEHRGFISGGEAVLRFRSTSAITVRALTAFRELGGDRAEDIPIYTGRITVSLAEHLPDLLFPLGEPRDSGGDRIEGLELSESEVRLPYEYSGTLAVRYARSPRSLPDSDDGSLDLPLGREAMLPLLTAAYLWLDDDADRSQYYMALYRDALTARLSRGFSSRSEEQYETNGWA